MKLKELRKAKGLTQKQAAELIGISLRSYKQYENDIAKEGTIKYQYSVQKMESVGFIDEDHGILSLETIRNSLPKAFDGFHVEYCYLFGSYAKGTPNERSDVDLLVSTETTGIAYYGLAESLREHLKKRVDLLNVRQLNNNPKLLDEILRYGIKLFG